MSAATPPSILRQRLACYMKKRTELLLYQTIVLVCVAKFVFSVAVKECVKGS